MTAIRVAGDQGVLRERQLQVVAKDPSAQPAASRGGGGDRRLAVGAVGGADHDDAAADPQHVDVGP